MDDLCFCGRTARAADGVRGTRGLLLDQLKVRVTAHSGFLVGKAFDTNTEEELVELLDDQTIKSCLTDEALVWLEHADEFTQAKEALIAIRDANASIIATKAGWDNLATFTEMEELAQCEGVTVEDGHVTMLDFDDWGLTGQK